MDARLKPLIDSVWEQLDPTANLVPITPSDHERYHDRNESPTYVMGKEAFRRTKEELYEGSVEYLHHPRRWLTKFLHSYTEHSKQVLRDAKAGKITFSGIGQQIMDTFDVEADIERIDKEVLGQLDMFFEGNAAYNAAFENGEYDRASRINDGMKAAAGDNLAQESIEFYNNDGDIAIATGDVERYLDAVKALKLSDSQEVVTFRPYFEQSVMRLIEAAYNPSLYIATNRPLTDAEQKSIQSMFYERLVSDVADRLLGEDGVSTAEEFERIVKTLATNHADVIARFYPVQLSVGVHYGPRRQ